MSVENGNGFSGGSEQEAEGEVVVEVITSEDAVAWGAVHKTFTGKVYVMSNSAYPEARLFFTEAEWDAFVDGVRDGEFDLDAEGNLPPVPQEQLDAQRGNPNYGYPAAG